MIHVTFQNGPTALYAEKELVYAADFLPGRDGEYTRVRAIELLARLPFNPCFLLHRRRSGHPVIRDGWEADNDSKVVRVRRVRFPRKKAEP